MIGDVWQGDFYPLPCDQSFLHKDPNMIAQQVSAIRTIDSRGPLVSPPLPSPPPKTTSSLCVQSFSISLSSYASSVHVSYSVLWVSLMSVPSLFPPATTE